MKTKWIYILIFLFVKMPSAVAEGDGRQWVQMPPEARQQMLSNMRDHLFAITEIQRALSMQAFDKAADIAEKRLGASSTQAHGGHHLGKYMPKEMREIGIQMHQNASRFALTAQESAVEGGVPRALGSLSEMMNMCVACHARFRLHEN